MCSVNWIMLLAKHRQIQGHVTSVMHRFGQQMLEEATGSCFNTYLNLIERSTESVAAPSVGQCCCCCCCWFWSGRVCKGPQHAAWVGSHNQHFIRRVASRAIKSRNAPGQTNNNKQQLELSMLSTLTLTPYPNAYPCQIPFPFPFWFAVPI